MALTRSYSDLDLNFQAHPVTGDVLKKKDIAAIATSMMNLFQTSNYERLFQPDIGCALKQMLFEPLDSFSSNRIQDMIIETIGNFEPRVKLEGVEVQPNFDRNGYVVFVTFFYANNPLPITINLFLERVR